MNRLSSGALLQYLGLLMVLGGGWWEWKARLADPPGRGFGTVGWVAAVALLVLGTTIRIMSAERRPPAHRQAIELALEVTDADALTITPAMAEELRGSRPWVRTFGILIAITTVLMYAGSLGVLAVAAFEKDRASMGIIASGAVVYAAFATLYLTLLQYVRQHKTALYAVGPTLSNAALRNIVDSQRRILRYFGVMLCVAAVFVFLAVLAAVAGATFSALQ